MANAVNLMQSLVSISQFNRGQATKIFDRLHSERGKIKGEQKQFKELTTGNVVIMGRKSYEEIGRPLPNRKDIICTDSIPAKLLADFKGFTVTKFLMETANEGAVCNPCPPFFRGEEISEDVIDSGYFVGYDFKKSLIKVQQAILLDLLGLE